MSVSQMMLWSCEVGRAMTMDAGPVSGRKVRVIRGLLVALGLSL